MKVENNYKKSRKFPIMGILKNKNKQINKKEHATRQLMGQRKKSREKKYFDTNKNGHASY